MALRIDRTLPTMQAFAMQQPTEERYPMTGRQLEDRMAMLLGGRGAEVNRVDHA